MREMARLAGIEPATLGFGGPVFQHLFPLIHITRLG